MSYLARILHIFFPLSLVLPLTYANEKKMSVKFKRIPSNIDDDDDDDEKYKSCRTMLAHAHAHEYAYKYISKMCAIYVDKAVNYDD